MPGLERMQAVNIVWSLCNQCERMYANEDLLLCDTCGESFCPFCDSMSQYSLYEELLDKEEDALETFCSRVCKRTYEGGYRRTSEGFYSRTAAACTVRSRSTRRRRPRFYDSSDESDGSSSPIGR